MEPGYIPITAGQTTVYISNAQSHNAIQTARIAENHLCFTKVTSPLSPGRSAYQLLEASYENCQEDKAAWSVGEIGEIDLFGLNQIPYNELAQY